MLPEWFGLPHLLAVFGLGAAFGGLLGEYGTLIGSALWFVGFGWRVSQLTQKPPLS
jgi:hypothetical protein